MKIILMICAGCALTLGTVAYACVKHFVGGPKAVKESAFDYSERELPVTYGAITLYGKALIPKGEGPFPTVIYAHGAESDYKADMTTLKSLAMSGIACYTFDFYGWTNRSTGPKGVAWFKHSKQRNYESKILIQVDDLNAVVSCVKTLDFVDGENLYLLGSSMGGATVAAAAVTHSEDIRGVILQYPAINLNPDAMIKGTERNVNGYTGLVLILQGTKDKIVPLSMSKELHDYYNGLYQGHSTLELYEGQPHVFTGRYKIKAAERICQFITKTSDGI